ncbi:MAG: hypothetical protein R2715_15920 [Ilumatobacteraceae bacterium]
MGALEELTDLGAMGPVERTRRRQVVDEEAIALVGRDPPGRGVRLAEVALLLSSTAISLRTVAEDTRTPGGSAMWVEPTGCAVSMYSWTTARRIAVFRSSSTSLLPGKLRQ